MQTEEQWQEDEEQDKPYTFSLTAKEVENLQKFQDMCEQIADYAHAKEFPMRPREIKNFYQYIFSYTGMGLYCAVECVNLGIGVNLTDYNGW